MLSVSIAMATYNGANYIEQQLASLASQGTLPRELIITDDGSSDDTVHLIEQFERRAPFQVVVHRNPKRLGYRENFMLAASLCTSDLIAFCDQDDVWASDKLTKCIDLFTSSAVLLVYHDAKIINASGSFIGDMASSQPSRHIHPPLSLDPWLHVLGFSQVFRRSLLDFHQLWSKSIDQFKSSERMAHDQWVPFLASVLGTTAYIREPLVLYRQHEGNLYGSSTQPQSLVKLFSGALPDVQRYISFEKAAGSRASVLEQLAKNIDKDEEFRNFARIGGLIYRRIEEHYRRRRSIYSFESFVARWNDLSTIFLEGGYGKDQVSSFGPKSLLKDLIIGLPIGPMIATHLTNRRRREE
jgi:glycosyltransferase involved in cell wall biosynthesis